LRGRAEEAGGFAVLEAGPVELKREFAVWGEGADNLDLMGRLKESFDPAGTIGCGRFLPGL
ncbi:MAG: FAD-binding oxidoreductase, partial [Armatimonadetes bacterium]|nr:FAD-binding oxidoreductase [Armatimonadota bacterium]